MAFNIKIYQALLYQLSLNHANPKLILKRRRILSQSLNREREVDIHQDSLSQLSIIEKLPDKPRVYSGDLNSKNLNNGNIWIKRLATLLERVNLCIFEKWISKSIYIFYWWFYHCVPLNMILIAYYSSHQSRKLSSQTTYDLNSKLLVHN